MFEIFELCCDIDRNKNSFLLNYNTNSISSTNESLKCQKKEETQFVKYRCTPIAKNLFLQDKQTPSSGTRRRPKFPLYYSTFHELMAQELLIGEK